MDVLQSALGCPTSLPMLTYLHPIIERAAGQWWGHTRKGDDLPHMLTILEEEAERAGPSFVEHIRDVVRERAQRWPKLPFYGSHSASLPVWSTEVKSDQFHHSDESLSVF